MKKDTQTRIIRTLANKGYTATALQLTTGLGVKIDTDYDGLYPGQAQFNALNDIRKTYSKNYTVESRGYYTAIFIY